MDRPYSGTTNDTFHGRRWQGAGSFRPSKGREPMHPHFTRDFPHVLRPHDMSVMGEAYLLAMVDQGGTDLDPEALARMILRFYRKGLADSHKLAALALLAVAPHSLTGGAN